VPVGPYLAAQLRLARHRVVEIEFGNPCRVGDPISRLVGVPEIESIVRDAVRRCVEYEWVESPHRWARGVIMVMSWETDRRGRAARVAGEVLDDLKGRAVEQGAVLVGPLRGSSGDRRERRGPGSVASNAKAGSSDDTLGSAVAILENQGYALAVAVAAQG